MDGAKELILITTIATSYAAAIFAIGALMNRVSSCEYRLTLIDKEIDRLRDIVERK